jgi:repressor of nif and glnA expression
MQRKLKRKGKNIQERNIRMYRMAIVSGYSLNERIHHDNAKLKVAGFLQAYADLRAIVHRME